MSDVATMNWEVRPGYAVSAGGGMAGGILGGKWSTAKELIKKLATQLGMKGAGAIKGLATSATPGFKNQSWTTLEGINTPFSAGNLHDSTGRVSILGASVAQHGYYGCYVSASDGLISMTPLFESASVDVAPPGFDMQLGVLLGMWWEAYAIPNDGS